MTHPVEALVDEESSRWRSSLAARLEAAAAEDRAAREAAEPSGPASTCPTLPRHHRAALRHDWSAEELLHVEDCRRCTRMQATVESTLWHPTLLSLTDLLRSDSSRRLDDHLGEDGDGCVRCKRLLASPWLHELAAQRPDRPRRRAPQDLSSERSATAFGEMPRAVGHFATGTRPPFQLRAEASRGDLAVTLRETDQGQLVVHVESNRKADDGLMVRVELLGEGDPVVADIELKAVEGEPGCIGRHAFGAFAELVPQLRPAVALLAVLVEKAPS